MAKQNSHTPDLLNNVGIHTAYGSPVELDGATIVPVAAAGFMFGTGSGDAGEIKKSNKSNGENETDVTANASGGGGYAFPLGAYVSRDGHTKFEPNVIALTLVAVPFIFVTGRVLTRLIRALKK